MTDFDTIEQTYPIGSVWNHKSYGSEEFTILGHVNKDEVLIGYEPGREGASKTWPRTALDWFGTLVRNAPTNVQEDTMTNTTRPTIDFSTPSRATAREYARSADSRVLLTESRNALQAAGRGEEVDAYALNAAITDAMRSATTRHGQSMGRRDLAKKIAHLGHITQAVLENHADGLPAYDTGERSRLLEEVKPALTEARQEVERLTRRVQELTEERGLLTQAASDERRRLCGDIDGLRLKVSSLYEEIDENHRQAVAEGAEYAAKLRGVTEDLTRHVALREFVEENLLDEGQRDQCIGFTHGFAAAERD